jgi:hypothetical protein
VGQRVDFFFECSRWSGVPRLLKADKAAELRWFDLDALPTPVVPHELFVLETLADGGGEQALSVLRRCFTGWEIHVDETIPAAVTERRNGVLHELRSTLIKFVAQAPHRGSAQTL